MVVTVSGARTSSLCSVDKAMHLSVGLTLCIERLL